MESVAESLPTYVGPPRTGQGRVGRPTKLTPAIANTILASLKRGAYLETACNAAGIAYGTMRQWVAKGVAHKEDNIRSVYRDFADKLARAQANVEMDLAERVASQTDADWRAGAFILERRFRDRWGKNDQPQAANVTIVLADTQQSALLELLRLSQAKDVTPTPEP